ncbi:hypothetical protein K7711_09085 [Nocardia sp. CA2R105]|uniref:hypothetical protein n=1 Tax=Nocardia coffeae TaxID=2873381 RepID=UPI001CA73378|nr:hypothetical protein [Nocardia coffeae]MBY8856627.1 hypothetical protein [Nocardia coffeae]
MREREKIVTAAVRDYINAWHAIGLVQQRRDTDIDDLKRRIEDVTAHAEQEIAGHEQAQAAAASTIQDQGHTDTEIAELLEISTKRARQLISASRQTETTKLVRAQPDIASGQPNPLAGNGSEDAALLPEVGRTSGSHPGSEEKDDSDTLRSRTTEK